MSQTDKTLFICDSHIFSIRQHLLKAPEAGQFTFLPVFFYKDPWKTLQEGGELRHDSSGQYSIPRDQFLSRVVSGELVEEGPLDVQRFRRIVFFGHFLVDRCAARTLSPEVCLYPDVRPSTPDVGGQESWVSWAAYAEMVRQQLEWPVINALRAIASRIVQGEQRIVVVSGPPIRRDVLPRATGESTALRIVSLARILQVHQDILGKIALEAGASVLPERWSNFAVDQEGFLLDDYAVGPRDSHANARFGQELLDRHLWSVLRD